MKKLTLILFISFFVLSCQETTQKNNIPTIAFDEETELKKIIQVIEKETECFFARDYECWKQQWVNAPYTYQAWNNADGTFSAAVGWNEVDSQSGTYLKENPITEGEINERKVKRENMEVKFFSGNVAYLLWKQTNEARNGKVFHTSREVRLIEKIDHDWKIASIASHWDYKNLIPK